MVSNTAMTSFGLSKEDELYLRFGSRREGILVPDAGPVANLEA